MLIESRSVAEATTAELRRRLLAGDYAGGDELRDTELSEQFGVARPTIRAAVQTLVADGLLERGRGRSARVRSFTAEDAVDLYRLRRPLELAAVRLASESHAPLDQVDRAASAFLALPHNVTWDSVADHDIGFHRAVIATAASPRLLRTFDTVSAELRLLIAQLRPAYRDAHELAEEHAVLAVTLRTGRQRAITSAWQEHLDSGEAFFLDLIKERA